MSRQGVTTESLAPTVGPYSYAVYAGGFVFLSGQVALDPGAGALVDGDVGRQTAQVLANLEVVLRAAGKSFADVVKTCVFLTDMKDFPVMNAVYARHFEAPYPARTTVVVAALPLGAAVEIDLVTQ
jgi:2-iminobutanoate/2-iminopropanoate deaminase